MPSIESVLASFRAVSDNPNAVMDEYLADGKKIIGVGPYYVPEELVYAAGAIPFGVWGYVGTAREAQKYFPPFYCSICQMTLEMGLSGMLDKLSGFMATGLCDTLRAASQNWRAGVKGIPLIYVSQPQNRREGFGLEYATESYGQVKRKVEECVGAIIEDDALKSAIRLYNEWRGAMREFVKLAGTHPAEVSVADRVAVVRSGYFQDKSVHLESVRQLNSLLASLPDSTQGYRKIVLSGIYEDIPAITDILDENRFAVVADDLAKESRAYALQVPEEGDPIRALAAGFCALEADSLLYDPEKLHVSHVADLARENGADGVVILLAKFCDPEEFDAPFIAKTCREAGMAQVTVEIDQSTESYEQARTQLETLAEIIG